MRIAVVIPTLNEAEHLGATLDSLTAGRPDALVVADCSSTDGTAEIARQRGTAVVTGAHLDSRAAALQAGVVHLSETGTPLEAYDAVWFLHGDTLAPPGWRSAIEALLADPAVVGGAFTQRFTPNTPRPTWVQRRLLRFVCFCNRTRYRLTGVYFGDQGIFVRPAALAQVGGVPQAPLMEDVDLCRALRRRGKLRVSRVRISTSPRRFLKHGVIRQLLVDWWLLLRHRLGVRSEQLHAQYNADNAEASGNAKPLPN